MDETFNIILIANVLRSSYDRDAIVEALSSILIGKHIWTALPGAFAFKSKVNVIQVQDLVAPVCNHCLVLRFYPDQVDGRLEDKEWTSWSGDVFMADIRGLLAFHGGEDLTDEQWLAPQEKD